MIARSKSNELEPPPLSELPNAREILRVWAAPNAPQQLSLDTLWDDPATWGLLLADVARHASIAYSQQINQPANKILERIKMSLQAELESPTDTPLQVS